MHLKTIADDMSHLKSRNKFHIIEGGLGSGCFSCEMEIES